MKPTKNTVLKTSNYTAALTRSLKDSDRLHCKVNDETHAIYVCNGYFLVRLDRAEYDALVRPVTQREAGNFVLFNGETDTAREPLDMAALLTTEAANAAHELTRAPFLVEPPKSRNGKSMAVYYSGSGDFVAGFNSEYAAIISASLPRKSKDPVSPMVVFSNDEPQAMILPVRIDEKESRIPAAVRAYFTDKPEEPADEKLEQARRERDEWKNKARRLEAGQYSREHELVELRAALFSQNEQIETMTARLNVQPEPKPDTVENTQPEQIPADRAAVLVEKLTALNGITATIKGAQTAAPVVWLTGEAEAHREKIEAMGGKWSVKREAWYFKI